MCTAIYHGVLFASQVLTLSSGINTIAINTTTSTDIFFLDAFRAKQLGLIAVVLSNGRACQDPQPTACDWDFGKSSASLAGPMMAPSVPSDLY